jgi:hypothetical protein
MKLWLILIVTLSVYAQDYSFLKYQNNFEKALKLAKKEHKLLMLFEVQDYCGWCSKQANSSLMDTDVKDEIANNFIPLLLNVDHADIPPAYRPEAVPALYFINPNENEEVWRAVGYKKSNELLEVFRQARKSYAEDLADEQE